MAAGGLIGGSRGELFRLAWRVFALREWRTRSLVAALTVAVLAMFVVHQAAVTGLATPTPARLVRASALPPDTHPPTLAGERVGSDASIDFDAVVEKVAHRVTPDPEVPGRLLARDPSYDATFDSSGFQLSMPDREPSDEVPDFGVSLRGMRRGTAIDLSMGPWTAEGNAAVRSVSSNVVERVTAHDSSVEWDLVLEAEPAGEGDLEVVSEVTGASLDRQSDKELSWSVDGGRMEMGELVVKDATGAVLYRAMPEVTGSTLHLTVPASVVAGARYPLTLDPVVGPERPVSGFPGAPGRQAEPAVAFDGANYLVVWADGRLAESDIFGARVSPAGVVLDSAGIAISTAADTQSEPAVAFNGSNFLVTWTDLRSPTPYTPGVYGTRVSPGGAVLDPAGIPIATAFKAAAPAVACGSGTCLVVWWDDRAAEQNIFGTMVSGAGVVASPSGVAISVAAGFPGQPTVAFNGTSFLVVWEDGRADPHRDIYGARVTSAGAVLDAGGIAISTSHAAHGPAITSDGTNWLVVWYDGRSGTTSDIYGARLSSGGSVLDPGGRPISAAQGEQSTPVVAFDGTNYRVAWADFRAGPEADVYGARVNRSGATLDSSGLPISTAAGHQAFPAMAVDGTNSFVVWTDERPDPSAPDVIGARVDQAGVVVGSAKVVVSVAPATDKPVVAFDGTNYLVVWQDNRSRDNSEIYGTRVTPAGSVLDGTGIAISPPTAASIRGNAAAPDVAFDGTNYLVVWDEFSGSSLDIVGVRISRGGAVLAPGRFEVSKAEDNQMNPAVAFNGENHLVVWEDSRSTTDLDLYGTRVTPGGVVLELVIVSTAAGDQSAPAVASGGTSWLVAWSDSGSAADTDIHSTVIPASPGNGTPEAVVVSSAAGDQGSPALAFNGWRYLVVWDDRRSSTSSDIYGSLVSVANVVHQSAGIRMSAAAGDQSYPVTSARGTDFLVAWEDRRSGTNSDIYATRVDNGGSVLDGASGFAVSSAPANETRPAMSVTHPSGTWTLVYGRPLPGQPPLSSGRTFLRTVSPK